jgi:addiction module HigA family antidote
MLPTNRPPTHPGEMLLKEFLEPLGVSQVEAARRMKIPFQRLNAIVKGRRADLAVAAIEVRSLARHAGARTATESARPSQERLTGPFRDPQLE